MKVTFLLLDHVVKIHIRQIELYGGTQGIRDLDSLKSALNTPAITFSGQFLHPTIYEMAAAYIFHIVKNHPFIDGNKRTATVSALSFLMINGKKNINVTNENLVKTILLVAKGKLNKSELAIEIKKWVKNN